MYRMRNQCSRCLGSNDLSKLGVKQPQGDDHPLRDLCRFGIAAATP